MKVRYLSVAAVIFLACPAQAQKINRCPSASGGVLYQQEPCAGGRSVKVVSPVSASEPGNAASVPPAWKTQVKEAENRERVRLAILERRVFPGMTSGELTQSWGSPTRVNKAGVNESWLYQKPGTNDQVVLVVGGVVRDVQGSN
jgi:hypothetical protein